MRSISRGLALCLLASSFSFAQTAVDVRTYNTERMRLSLDRDGLIDVEAPTTPGHLTWEAGVWLGVSKNPIVITDAATGKRLGALLEHRESGAVWASVGLSRFVELGFELPFTFYQARPEMISGATTGTLEPLQPVTAGNLRVAGKVSLLRQDRAGINLALLASLGLPTGTQNQYAAETSFTGMPELSIGRTWGRLRAAFNAGVFLRPQTQFLNLTVHHELFGKLGLGWRLGGERALDAPWEIALSAATATRLLRPLSESNNRSLEVHLMVARSLGQFAQLFAGGGLGLLGGWGTPEWRAFGGLRFSAPRTDDSTLPRDGDHGGVSDADELSDADHDGLVAEADSCPAQAGLARNRGCPDTDDDGVIDSLDRCPAESEDFDQFQDSDGCPDPDNDADGVLDALDACPGSAGPAENRGCPDTDRDGDGLVDRLDNCPSEKGPPKNYGCVAKQLVAIVPGRIEQSQPIVFRGTTEVIEPGSYAVLNNLARVLAVHPEIERVVVEGHTGSDGPAGLNTSLSNRRAQSVVVYLIRKGVSAARLMPVGFGSTRPLTANATPQGRAANQRIVFTIEKNLERGSAH